MPTNMQPNQFSAQQKTQFTFKGNYNSEFPGFNGKQNLLPDEVSLGSWRQQNQLRKINNNNNGPSMTKDQQLSVKAPAFVPA